MDCTEHGPQRRLGDDRCTLRTASSRHSSAALGHLRRPTPSPSGQGRTTAPASAMRTLLPVDPTPFKLGAAKSRLALVTGLAVPEQDSISDVAFRVAILKSGLGLSHPL